MSQNRFLLGNDEEMYLEVEDSVDPFNLHSYDEFDWIALILTESCFALIFFCIGWCLHKICVYNKLRGNTEEDIETLVTKMSFTHSNYNHKLSNFIHSFHRPHLPHLSQKQPSLSMVKGSNNVHLPKINPAFNGIATIATYKEQPSTTKLKGSVPMTESGLNHHKRQPAFQKSFSVLSDLPSLTNDQKSNSNKLELPKTQMSVRTPTLSTGMPTPASNGISQTHISMHLPMDYSENPYKTANLMQSNQTSFATLDEANENSKTTTKSNRRDGDVIIVLQNNVSARTPLTTPLTSSPQ